MTRLSWESVSRDTRSLKRMSLVPHVPVAYPIRSPLRREEDVLMT